jgi:hypothetical protein
VPVVVAQPAAAPQPQARNARVAGQARRGGPAQARRGGPARPRRQEGATRRSA